MNKEESGDSTAPNVVEAPVETQVLDEAGLTKLFMNTPMSEALDDVKVEEESQDQEEAEEVEATEETEVEEVAEESETEDTEETEEEEVEEADNVLSKSDKTQKKMRKRIDKATKKWRTAEETIESRDKEIETLKQQLSSTSGDKSSDDQSFKEVAKKADSIDELQAVYDKAEKAEEWIEEALDQLRDSGEASLIVNETEYTRQEIKAFQKEVRQAMKKDIPARAKVFEQRQQYDTHALKEFEFLSDPKSEGYGIVEQIMGDKGLSEFLSGRADQMQILGWLAEGIQTTNAKQSKQSSSGEGKAKDAVKKPASPPKIAPSLGFTRAKVASTRKSPNEKLSQRKAEIGNKGSINQHDLATLFM